MSATQADNDVPRTANPLSGLTGFQRDLFVLIAEFDEKPSGQDIMAAIQPHYETEITSGRLYPNLDSLTNLGFVDRGEIDRRTNSYTLSDEGREALEQYKEFVGACV